MFPVVATGALNPEPGLTAAVSAVPGIALTGLPIDVKSFDDLPPLPTPLPHGAEVLARQILDAVSRGRTLGHRGQSITLTRPTAVAEAVYGLLRRAGLEPALRPASIGGCSVLSLRP